MSSFDVIWTLQASRDLEEIIDYILVDNFEVANKLFNKIKTSCTKLKNNPEKYRVVPELKEVGIIGYREIILSPYRILFKLTAKKVYIFAVIDGRRDMQAFLFSRLVRD